MDERDKKSFLASEGHQSPMLCLKLRPHLVEIALLRGPSVHDRRHPIHGHDVPGAGFRRVVPADEQRRAPVPDPGDRVVLLSSKRASGMIQETPADIPRPTHAEHRGRKNPIVIEQRRRAFSSVRVQ